MLPGGGFYTLSYSLLAIIYGVAILVPNGECQSLAVCCERVIRGKREHAAMLYRSCLTPSPLPCIH